jgi:murein DD-endopeptidase MepM/ murein hydrolase activator NlpD
MAILSYYFFNLTGIGNKILPGDFRVKTPETEKVELLNQKIIFLAHEIQKLKATNQKLKFALALGDSGLADTLGVEMDSVEQYYRYPAEGNILTAFLRLINYEEQKSDEKVFFILPVNGYISRQFDPEKGHNGLDIAVKEGSPVYAAASGFVLYKGYTIEDGNVIIINHSDGYLSLYKHCSVVIKKEMDKVEQGELIAQSGNSGLHSTGPHLHFEIWKNGILINPQTVIISNN